MSESGKNSPALRIVLMYLLAGCLWIAFSDKLLARVSSRSILMQLSIIKGLVFVCITAALLYYLINRHFTDQENIRQALADSEERLRMALTASRTGVWEWDLRTDHVVWSPEVYGIVGFKDFDGRFESFGRLLHPEDAERVTANVQQALADHAEYSDEFRILLPDSGEVRWLANQGQGKYAADGTPLVLLGTVRDVTAQKTAQAALIASEERLKLLLQSVQVGFWDWDLWSGLAYLSPEYYEIAEYNAEDVVPDLGFFESLVHPEDWDHVMGMQTRHLRGETEESSVEFRIISGSGSVKWISSKGKVVERDQSGAPLRMLGTMIDITGRKMLDESLRKSDERLRRFYDSGLLGVVYWNIDGSITDANDKFLEMVGYNREELAAGSINWISMTPPEYSHLDNECIEELLATGVNRKPFEKEYVRKNGERIPILLSGAMLEKDSIDGIAYIMDISDLKRAEHALRASEERYRRLFEVESDAILLVDCDTGRFIDANSAALQLYGYSREELLQMRHRDVSADPQLTEEVFAGNITSVPIRRHRKKDGTIFPVEIAGAYFEYQRHKVHVAAIRDITLRQRAEETLLGLTENLRSLTERLQTVQELERLAIARDIHDEIGQQLTALKLDIAWLRHRISEDGNQLGERLDDMGHNIDLLIGTVQRIAADLRPPLLDNLGLAAAIGWQVNEFTRRSGIECLTMLNEDADPSDPQTATTIVRIVQEALTNVIRHSEATEVCISLCRNDDGLLLEISDNGRGVSEQEIAARDSYGLIGMQERARICHGVLTVTGSPGCGTRLRLTIPIEKGATEL